MAARLAEARVIASNSAWPKRVVAFTDTSGSAKYASPTAASRASCSPFSPVPIRMPGIALPRTETAIRSGGATSAPIAGAEST